MQTTSSSSDTSTLRASIVKWSLIVGTFSFAAGFFGPIFLSSSNLGPLLGVICTGPMGLLAGALWGAVRWATLAEGREVGAVTGWILRIWLFTLFYTLVMVRWAARAALPGVGVQLLILLASVFILYRRDIRRRLPVVAQKAAPIAPAVIAVIVLMTLFPPVTRPWWGPRAATGHQSVPAPLPKVAFILHPAFDASKHVPDFAVNGSVLALEWIGAMMTGALTFYLVARRSRQATTAWAPEQRKVIKTE